MFKLLALLFMEFSKGWWQDCSWRKIVQVKWEQSISGWNTMNTENNYTYQMIMLEFYLQFDLHSTLAKAPISKIKRISSTLLYACFSAGLFRPIAQQLRHCWDFLLQKTGRLNNWTKVFFMHENILNNFASEIFFNLIYNINLIVSWTIVGFKLRLPIVSIDSSGSKFQLIIKSKAIVSWTLVGWTKIKHA